jgi:hypothetical protein
MRIVPLFLGESRYYFNLRISSSGHANVGLSVQNVVAVEAETGEKKASTEARPNIYIYMISQPNSI